jgi:hypothetical protein
MAPLNTSPLQQAGRLLHNGWPVRDMFQTARRFRGNGQVIDCSQGNGEQFCRQPTGGDRRYIERPLEKVFSLPSAGSLLKSQYSRGKSQSVRESRVTSHRERRASEDSKQKRS